MALLLLPWYYLLWHYSAGVRDLLGIIVNFFWFVGNLFSVKTLLTTLIRPLKLIEERPASLLKEPDIFFQNLLVNTIMRIVGLIVRLVLILIAFIGWAILCVGGAALLVFWIGFPAFILALAYFSIGAIT